MIQIDIPMPKTCIECPFVIHPKYWNECLFTHEGITSSKRQCKCPLVESPIVPQVTVFAENASTEEIEDFKKELENVLERQKGEWIENKEHAYLSNGDCKEWTNFYCSVCDAPSNTPYNFCPSCGAKMHRDA